MLGQAPCGPGPRAGLGPGREALPSAGATHTPGDAHTSRFRRGTHGHACAVGGLGRALPCWKAFDLASVMGQDPGQQFCPQTRAATPRPVWGAR